MDKTKYIVLDVETNGLSSVNDDLLSISIFKPDTEDIYTRFLPLELNSRIYTSDINGIHMKDIKNKKPITQEEWNELSNHFELYNRTILTYGNIDEKFITKYLLRHHIKQPNNLVFYNFKHNIISSKFSEGNITKDNLCRLFNIDGVKEIHSGANDCILEWKLFEKLDNRNLLITNNNVFILNSDYIIPASYLDTYPNFKYYTNLYDDLYCRTTKIYKYPLISDKFKHFDTNITGQTIEHLINTLLNVERIDSRDFLIKNKQKLQYIYSLHSNINNIYVDFTDDGLIKAINKKDEYFIDTVNDVTLEIKSLISPVIDFIKHNIFNDKKIMSQELTFSQNKKVLALCDLSNEDSILEIKTGYFDPNYCTKQLYVESNGRKCFLLQLDWNSSPNKINVVISEVTFGHRPKLTDLEHRTKLFKSKIKDHEIEVLSYTTIEEPVKLRCKKCGHIWETSTKRAIKEHVCPICYPKIQKSKTKHHMEAPCNKMSNCEKFMEKVKVLSNGIIECDKYTSSRDNASFHCTICGKTWETRADHIVRIINQHDCCNNPYYK